MRRSPFAHSSGWTFAQTNATRCRYANRAKNIRNKPTLNENANSEVEAALRAELALLKDQIIGGTQARISSPRPLRCLAPPSPRPLRCLALLPPHTRRAPELQRRWHPACVPRRTPRRATSRRATSRRAGRHDGQRGGHGTQGPQQAARAPERRAQGEARKLAARERRHGREGRRRHRRPRGTRGTPCLIFACARPFKGL